MIFTATLTDKVGRRPLTVYPYAVTVVSVLCLGIIGCFDYTSKTLGSLLVGRLTSARVRSLTVTSRSSLRVWLRSLLRGHPPSDMLMLRKSLNNDYVRRQPAGHWPFPT